MSRTPALATLVALLAGALAPAVRADVLVLRSGSRLSFASCEQHESEVVCHTDAGTVSFRRAAVLQILRGSEAEAAAPTWRAERPDKSSADPFGGFDPGATELALEGFAREQDGAWESAEAAYREALAEGGAHRAARLGLARVLLRQGRAREAATELEVLIVDSPDTAQAHFLLGLAYDELERLDEAVRAWEKAASLDPAFEARYREGRKELGVHQDFHRALAPHFTVSFDGDRDEALGEGIVEALEDAFDEFVTRFEHYPERTIQVILYSRRDFEEVTGAGAEVGGLFDGKVRLPVGGLQRVTPRVVALARHELAHAFLHDKGRGRVPRWIHEGLAQRVEPRTPPPARSVVNGLRAASRPLAWAAEFSYPKALSRVAHLEEQYGEGRLLDLVAALGDGLREEEATRDVFGVSPSRLILEWAEWLGWEAP